MKNKMWSKIFIAVFIGVISIACIETGPSMEKRKTVPFEELESLKATLDIGAGEMFVDGGAGELFEGDFSFNVERWEPEIDYTRFDGRGVLTIRQGKSRRGTFGKAKNIWDVRFHDDIPLDLRIDFGVGEGEVDLSTLWMKNLAIDMGVGELDLDLCGDYQEDFMVEIDGGIGSATIYLPEDIGVRVDVDGGLGSVDAPGFEKRGSVYTNDAYRASDITIEIRIDAGIGSIDLVLR